MNNRMDRSTDHQVDMAHTRNCRPSGLSYRRNEDTGNQSHATPLEKYSMSWRDTRIDFRHGRKNSMDILDTFHPGRIQHHNCSWLPRCFRPHWCHWPHTSNGRCSRSRRSPRTCCSPCQSGHSRGGHHRWCLLWHCQLSESTGPAGRSCTDCKQRRWWVCTRL